LYGEVIFSSTLTGFGSSAGFALATGAGVFFTRAAGAAAVGAGEMMTGAATGLVEAAAGATRPVVATAG
jgi:hypothetical protein